MPAPLQAASHLIHGVQTAVSVWLSVFFKANPEHETALPEPVEPFNGPAHEGERGVGKAFLAIWPTFLAKHNCG
jgi:hypothetical protein